MSKTISDKINRKITYINKDFNDIRTFLINYAKNYFPNTYGDFNESSPGMMFIEMMAAIGDQLSFYGDVQLAESFLYTVNEKKNLYNLAQSLGYKPQSLIPAQVDLDVMQLIPSIGTDNNVAPDWRYALNIKENMVVRTNNNIYFRTVDPVDFKYSSSFNPTVVDVHSVLPDGTIEYFLLKKTVKAVQGSIHTSDYVFTTPKIYDKIIINDEDISEIISVVDSDGDNWYEVPYLAQDLIPLSMRNTPYNDPELYQYNSSVPYLLSYKQTERRFITRVRQDNKIELQFGAGLSSEADEEILPNPYNVAIGLDYFKRVEDISIDPVNFLYTKTYGSAPADTTLTVNYSKCNGLLGNVKANTINTIVSKEVENPYEIIDSVIWSDLNDSIIVNNPAAAYGGMNKKSHDIIREEAMAHFAAQNRSVTKDDYILRCYTMPDRFGAIAKAYIEQDTQLSKWNDKEKILNPFALNLYILSYNDDKQFVPANRAIKENLRQYLRQYRMLTDAVNIKDPYIINVGVEYEIITRPSYNSNEVLLRCNNRLIELLSNDKMEINTPIILNNLTTELDKLDGVQTVQNLEIINLYDTDLGYSSNVYDIKTATRYNVVYPSLDPCIFEVKYPKSDIKGRVIDI